MDALFERWNKHAKNNNCYAFAFDALNPNAQEKLQPGDLSGMDDIPDDQYKCPDLVTRIQRDYPDAVVIHPREYTRNGGHRVALFIDDKGDKRDYHFYREMADGTWWHKPGSLPVSKVDDSGETIRNPLTADRDYTRDGDETSNYNYSTFCVMLWVPDKRERERRPVLPVSTTGNTNTVLVWVTIVSVILILVCLLVIYVY